MEMSPLTHYWDTILESIRVRVTQQTFDTWFVPLLPTSWDQDSITIQCPNFFFKDWVSEHYHQTLENTMSEHFERPMRCLLTVDEHHGDASDELFDLEAVNQEPAGIPTEEHARSRSRPRISSSTSRIYLNKHYTFDSFVMGEGSKMAHAASIAVSEQPGRNYNPLFLYGGVGLGKTHLMHAIGNAAQARDRGLHVCYITAEQFMNDLIYSIQKNKTYEFKNEYRNVDVLLVDDVAFLAGKESTQEEFFHTFNALYNDNKQIVLTSDRPPKEIPTLEERLRSRFEWGLMVSIAPPDLETRMAILKKKVESNGIYISDDVVEFIATNVTNNIRNLEGALIKLLAYASLTRSEISLDMAQEVLSSIFLASHVKAATIADILKIVSDHFSVSIDQLKSKRRTQDLALARQVGMYIAREKIGAPFEKIGRVFGGRDHTTVMHAYKKIGKKCADDPYFRGVVKDLLERAS